MGIAFSCRCGPREPLRQHRRSACFPMMFHVKRRRPSLGPGCCGVGARLGEGMRTERDVAYERRLDQATEDCGDSCEESSVLSSQSGAVR